ncbi:MAG TPA: 50S ribosomal protein L5 [Candidatus Goldiibacteriota bacterium]|nr:50S ribosomal protein L5 [Candidatus Goldiibacteriota bacterium]HPN65536.1 50S ribosomal protein L5 [Candidatus Goldiibacteriota bacterium]HRQ42963.1 50S ribosomal protein L5 [Candidatus Goldiibacteriota bacterium]
MAARLKEKYKKEVIPKMMQGEGFKNPNEVPKLVKIVVNMGVGKATQDAKVLDEAVDQLTQITGQKPLVTKAKVAISNFKLRQGMAIGCKVTLRGEKMYEFADRLISLALPRVRDFNGVPRTSFDGRGNYTLGLKEQIIFPEIKFDKVANIMGMDVTFVTTAKKNEDALALLENLGMPFRKK